MRFTIVLILALLMMGCGYSSRNYMNSGSTGGTATPSISGLSPNTVSPGSAAFTLTVNGGNFGSGAVVYFNGTAESTMFVSANQVTAAIPSSAVASAATIPVYVHSGIYNSNTVNFMVQ
jgi:hypothetical protein